MNDVEQDNELLEQIEQVRKGYVQMGAEQSLLKVLALVTVMLRQIEDNTRPR